jgi:hypothetical protein
LSFNWIFLIENEKNIQPVINQLGRTSGSMNTSNNIEQGIINLESITLVPG